MKKEVLFWSLGLIFGLCLLAFLFQFLPEQARWIIQEEQEEGQEKLHAPVFEFSSDEAEDILITRIDVTRDGISQTQYMDESDYKWDETELFLPHEREALGLSPQTQSK